LNTRKHASTGFVAILIVPTLLLINNSAFADEPISVKYIGDVVVNNNAIYSHYKVICPNQRNVDISAWNNRKKWCLGKGKQNVCTKRQIALIKRACR
jgi:hypothetical protein